MNTNTINLLVIEDEEYDVKRIENTIRLFGEKIKITDVVSSGEDALECIQKDKDKYDIVIMDYQLSGGFYGVPLIQEIKRLNPVLQIIIITKMTTNQTNLQFANQLINSGAYWFGTKYPGDIEDYIYQPTDFVLSIMNAYEKKQLELEKIRSQHKLDRSTQAIISRIPIIGESATMKELKQLIYKYAEINANVLIFGESGTGKELVAAHIHYHSDRRHENFVTVNCAAIPKDLIESELFGFEKGSFTDAKQAKQGLFEQANGGSILLDEIGELPLPAQVKLLRVLQDGEIDKIGRLKKYQVDVRVIASTNKDLEAMLEKKQFREDLYYRLNILQIQIPPLRDRAEDIPLLIDYFIKYYCNDFGMIPPTISKSAMELLNNYSWPGNIRQLKNVIQKILLMSDKEVTDTILRTTLGKLSRPEAFIPTTITSHSILPLKEIEIDFRRKYIQFVRKRCRNDAEAARKLGLAPPNFHRLCKELGLK